jgi:hypothetical protein
MRIYEGSNRQDWEEVLRSVGADFDRRGIRNIVFLETDTGFIVQGDRVVGVNTAWSDSMGKALTETQTIPDEDVARFMEEAIARRGQPPNEMPVHYERELRVIGRYLDERRPRSVFLFEQDGAYVVRITATTQAGYRHELVEFTRDDLAAMIAKAPSLRHTKQEAKTR